MAISINNKMNNPIEGNSGLNPKKFMMLISMVSMSMLFIALTSALLVKKGDTIKWANFNIPSSFLLSTFVIVLSSITIQWSFSLYTKGKSIYKGLLFFTFLLSLVFTFIQFYGWNQIKELGFAFNGNVSGSFVYVITGFHLAHLFGGMIALLVTLLVHLIRKNTPIELNTIKNINRKINFEVLLIFWHFLGALWIYLYAFLFLVYNI